MISVTILTKNSERYLAEVLEALRTFDEVLVYDTGSSDGTMKIAHQFPNVRICQGSFEGFGPTHNQASALAKNDWILSIDSDEIVSPALVKEIVGLSLGVDADAVYSIPRNNYYNGKWIRWCGWYPDRQVKLYHRKRTRFSEAQVHEAIICDSLKLKKLQSPIRHYPYGNSADFLNKMQHYSELFAKQNQGKKKSSFMHAVSHGAFAFFKSYLLKRGFLGGVEGFYISLYNANTAFYKYMKLAEKNREN